MHTIHKVSLCVEVVMVISVRRGVEWAGVLSHAGLCRSHKLASESLSSITCHLWASEPPESPYLCVPNTCHLLPELPPQPQSRFWIFISILSPLRRLRVRESAYRLDYYRTAACLLLFKAKFLTSQAGLKFTVQLSMTLRSWSFLPLLPKCYGYRYPP